MRELTFEEMEEVSGGLIKLVIIGGIIKKIIIPYSCYSTAKAWGIGIGSSLIASQIGSCAGC